MRKFTEFIVIWETITRRGCSYRHYQRTFDSLEASKPDRDDDGAKIGPDDRTNQDDIDPDRLNDPNDPGERPRAND